MEIHKYRIDNGTRDTRDNENIDNVTSDTHDKKKVLTMPIFQGGVASPEEEEDNVQVLYCTELCCNIMYCTGIIYSTAYFSPGAVLQFPEVPAL